MNERTICLLAQLLHLTLKLWLKAGKPYVCAALARNVNHCPKCEELYDLNKAFGVLPVLESERKIPKEVRVNSHIEYRFETMNPYL
jgi:hypothetical protein